MASLALCQRRVPMQVVHPDVQAEGEEQPRDDADAEVEPDQGEKIAAEQRERAAERAVHFLFVVGYGNDLGHVKPHAHDNQKQQDNDGGGFGEMVAGVGGNGLVLDVGVHRVGGGCEAGDGEQYDDEINQQAEEAPEMVAGGFEEGGGGGFFAEDVGGEDAAGGEEHE